jgi:hypothetical protein
LVSPFFIVGFTPNRDPRGRYRWLIGPFSIEPPTVAALFLYQHPAAVRSDLESLFTFEIEPIRRDPMAGQMQFEQRYALGQYPADTGRIHKYAAGAGLMTLDKFKQLPGAHTVKFTTNRNMKVSGIGVPAN